MGIWSAGGAAGAASGPTVAGVLLEHYYWGSVLLVNLPVVALIVAVGAWALPEARSEARHPLDPLSVVYLHGRNPCRRLRHHQNWPIHTGLAFWPGYVALALGGLLLWVFMQRQLRLPMPLLDLHLFTPDPVHCGHRRAVGGGVRQRGRAVLPSDLPSSGGRLLGPAIRHGDAAPICGQHGLRRDDRAADRPWGHRRILLAGLGFGSVGLVLLGLAIPMSYLTMIVP